MVDIPKTPEDFLNIAIIHKNELKNGGLVSASSIEFIKYFYEKINSYKSIILMVYRDSGSKINAFILCSTKHDDVYKKFLKQNLSALIKFKSLFFLLVKTAFKRALSRGFSHYESELVNIAVEKDSRRKGIAKMLIWSAEELMRSMNIHEYFLQVLASNSSAVNLYQDLGFNIVESIHSGNKLKYLMKKVI